MTIRHACIGFMGFLAGCGAVNDSTAEEEVAFVSSAPPATSAIPAVADGDDVLQSLNGDTGCLNTGDGDTTLRFINNCSFPVVFAGTRIPGGRLNSRAQACQTVGKNWERMISMRYWGFREGNDPGYARRSLAEFGFNQVFAGYSSWDWFDLSYVDAHNLPLKIVPYELGSGKTCAAQTRSCPQNLLPGCPNVGKLRNSRGEVISCVSPDRDNPNSPVVKYFDMSCNQAYSWSKDDSVMAACNAGDFDIVFCP